MTLPPSYNTSKEYVTDSLNILKSFQWLFNYNNTHILVNKVFENFPKEWLSYFNFASIQDLNQFSLGHTKDDCPASLKELLDKIESLKPRLVSVPPRCDHNISVSHNSGLSKKKLHEVTLLAPLIHQISQKNGINLIIDVGSGLGYLSHLLNYSYKHTVLGIECCQDKIDLAYKNQQKHFPNSVNSVRFANHLIKEDSGDEMRLLIDQHFQEEPEKFEACIAGLHACGDLSITILDLFTKLAFVKCLVIMPCCYHRVELEKTIEDKEYFKHFPASKLFKDLWAEFYAESFIRRTFLRLACQQTVQSFVNMTKEEHDKHSRSCMYRAILQEVTETEKCRVRRLKRKSGKTHLPDIEDDFLAYLNNLTNTHQLEYDEDTKIRVELDSEHFLEKMKEKWTDQKNNCHLMEVLTALQASLQSVCENLVLLDRVEFLKEKGFDCYVEKVTDDCISPRCYALVAVKT